MVCLLAVRELLDTRYDHVFALFRLSLSDAPQIMSFAHVVVARGVIQMNPSA